MRQLNPAATGDNDSGPASLSETLLGQDNQGLTGGIPGLNSDIPFIEFGGGGGGLLSAIAGVLGGGLF